MFSQLEIKQENKSFALSVLPIMTSHGVVRRERTLLFRDIIFRPTDLRYYSASAVRRLSLLPVSQKLISNVFIYIYIYIYTYTISVISIDIYIYIYTYIYTHIF